MKTLKLEVGKTYRSRKGEEVKIVKHDVGSPWPYCGSSGKGYAADGKWASMGSPCDLIEEVPSETRHTFAIPDGVKELTDPRYAFITPEEAKKVTATRYTFTIPDGVKELTVEQVGNRIVVEMVPEGPKPGSLMVNEQGSVYIFKEVVDNFNHKHYAWFGKDGRLVIGSMCTPGRPATPEEAQPLFDALKKAGKRWNPHTMVVEEKITEIDRIREWVEANIEYRHYTKEVIAEAIEAYLKYREGEK